ncbi:MAG: response regulator [Deltaproteobacteria bacterium]|nr:response regulator [Deltaproteobacteria bacterium]
MGLKILVVEPNIVARAYCVRALQLAGIDRSAIREASQGREALVMVREERVDLIITALAMPELDGPELLVALRGESQLANIPVVLLTSERNARRAAAIAQHGVRGGLERPFRPEAVRAVLNDLLPQSGATT